jgi:hypothetical protein
MAIMLSALGLTFASVCVWLGVRIVNRRERWAIWSAIGLGALFVVCLSLHQKTYWCGRAIRTINIDVVDASSDEPIPNAAIVVFHGLSEPGLGIPPSEPDESDARTQHLLSDATGTADADHTFFAYGHSRWFTEIGHVRLGDHLVRVTASGFDPIQFPLRDAAGDQRDHNDKSPIRLTVKLMPEHAP